MKACVLSWCSDFGRVLPPTKQLTPLSSLLSEKKTQPLFKTSHQVSLGTKTYHIMHPFQFSKSFLIESPN